MSNIKRYLEELRDKDNMKRILQDHWMLVDYEIYYNSINKTCYIIDKIPTKMFMVVKKLVGAKNYIVCKGADLKGGWV